MKTRFIRLILPVLAIALIALIAVGATAFASGTPTQDGHDFDRTIFLNSLQMLYEGKRTFRFDTFGDEAFWGDTLQLHRAIEGEQLGGVGPGVSPRTALTVGLKVDVDALPRSLIEQLKRGQVNLDDPATTLALLKLNAVVG
ncbi:MAG TPA: hypothetical protein VLG46_17400, partial [Anaerolineae bacterium]|nr:hypothetical protein [Anaerolineae bacterium]